MPETDSHSARRPVRLTASLDDLAGARATVHITAGLAFAAFGTVDVRAVLVDRPDVVRQLLTDALAQLDAAEAGR